MLCWNSSCEELISPELLTAPPTIVVEGTLRPDSSFVQLTQTTSFQENMPVPKLTGAQIQVFDFEDFPKQFEEVDSGVYFPIRDMELIPGRRYRLEVIYDSVAVTAENIYPSKPILDSIAVDFLNDRELTTAQESGYYLTLYINDRAFVRNYYRIDVFRNGKSISDDPEVGLLIQTDEGRDGKVLQYQVPFAFREQDSLKVELNGLSSMTYDYYRGVKLLTDAGSPSQSVPENPPSNLVPSSEVAVFGFFALEHPVSDSVWVTPSVID
ncbi:hypothetical protein GCM10023331_05640 [Algivirga pacifica]|uniref:DUF4249 domain-containing protein n=1 Tax=Algivirga pacifica TaxID=1162670 RepID=A0ABP9D065_9BACT